MERGEGRSGSGSRNTPDDNMNRCGVCSLIDNHYYCGTEARDQSAYGPRPSIFFETFF